MQRLTWSSAMEAEVSLRPACAVVRSLGACMEERRQLGQLPRAVPPGDASCFSTKRDAKRRLQVSHGMSHYDFVCESPAAVCCRLAVAVRKRLASNSSGRAQGDAP